MMKDKLKSYRYFNFDRLKWNDLAISTILLLSKILELHQNIIKYIYLTLDAVRKVSRAAIENLLVKCNVND